MIHEADLNILVSNVVSENLNKHCRLCLKEIAESYIKLGDFVSYDEESFHPLHQILTELLGKQILDEIPGVNVVCPDCLQKTLECCRFIDETKRASDILYKTFHNLSEALSVDLDLTDNYQRLYVVVGKEESVLLLADKDGINKDVLKESPKILNQTSSSLICTQCNYWASSKKELKDHKKELHGFNCINCNKLCLSEESLKQHLQLDHTGHYCIECGKSFHSIEKLQTHKQRHKTKSSNVSQKSIKLHRSAQIRKQKIEQDNDSTPLVCKECGKTCLGLEKLQVHEEKHNAKSECPKCKKVYLTKDFYMKHVELCLSEKLEPHPFRAKMEKKYRCDECDKGYSCQSGLNVHKKFAHGNFKGHICEICGKIFSAPSYLKTHMVKHTGEKNFSCHICPRNFVSKEALLYHTRRHTGEKPYSCNLCDERFVNASARAEHIKYKHQSPKFPCDICGRKFFTTSFLKQHRKRHSDPLSKLFTGRSTIPANKPTKQNMRLKAVIMEGDNTNQKEYIIT